MLRLPLEKFHDAKGAAWGEVNGAQVVHNYGATSAELKALTQSAGLIDFSYRGRVCVLGADRLKFLHGQVTNDVARLKPGEGCYAALVNAKGRTQSDLHIYILADEILLDFEPGLTSRIIDRLQQYIIADDVQVVDVAPHYGLLSIQGPAALDAVKASGLWAAIPEKRFQWTSTAMPTGELYLMNNPRLGTNGFDLFVPVAELEAVANRLSGTWCGWDAFETARVLAGIPRFGVDFDESNLAPEAELQDRAISYSKGCYIGQEVIARIRTYGQVAKALRLLRLSPGVTELPERGTKLYKDGKEVGCLGSSAFSQEQSAVVAFGCVRKECNMPGEWLEVGAPGGSAAQIVGVPGKINAPASPP